MVFGDCGLRSRQRILRRSKRDVTYKDRQNQARNLRPVRTGKLERLAITLPIKLTEKCYCWDLITLLCFRVSESY